MLGWRGLYLLFYLVKTTLSSLWAARPGLRGARDTGVAVLGPTRVATWLSLPPTTSGACAC